MDVLTAENLTKSYGEKVLFSEISFGIDEGDKIGIIGVNGAGKSTLLKILAGVEWPDQGQVTVGNSVRLEYLPQNPDFEDEATVLQQVFKGTSPVMQLLNAYESALEKLTNHPDHPAYQRGLLSLGQKMDAANAWQLESEAKTVLNKLGIHEFDAAVGRLSGGQRKRVALASALINPAEILVLDEPTNHIDNDTVDWLEQYLNKRKGALIMITHDRYFLDRMVTRIMELDQGKLYPYPGNYSRYLELKAGRLEREEASERKWQNRLRNELAWIQRGAQGRSTKQKARIERFKKLQAEKPPEPLGHVEIATGASRLGKKVLAWTHLHKEFSGRGVVIEDFSYSLLRNDRIGIIGPNGSGKSTLLNLLAGRSVPESGCVDWGSTVKIGYFAQENTEMNPDTRVIDYIKEVAEVIPTSDGRTVTAAQMLERFLFVPSSQWTAISKLSGGEKRRLYLLHILMGAPNVLLMDEPTNDLDIQTLTVLEEYLDEFPGAVLAVSHDRYFLDRMAGKIFAFTGTGQIEAYVGNYSDYQAWQLSGQVGPSVEVPSEKAQLKKAELEEEKPERRKERPLKMSYKEQREYEQIEDQIAQTEEELKEIQHEMNEQGSNFSRLQELTIKQQAAEQKLDEMLERWTYLNELAEKIRQGRSCTANISS
ncbi:Putative ABC transporter [Acididesulfobacillus acetoxydans]|uniref:ABC transporter n=1 Tax=Acididesulfobacillus acetoxydans TaxID=1561005 RepID=A0A8S0WZW2_9FIRM|nr:ABC-F family ATP-binding cassette domain-containing protein [Acididesulfobacillus acetoxydans]CAA7602201.1 Putative ABC transporter [Acididesulfobacillus acetoxydans]CEJ08757.1 ABC transporter ATP-binding protein uup [Acididesulfobacillus acetoxydans]